MKSLKLYIYFAFTSLIIFSCKKLIDTAPPKTQVTTATVFSDSGLINSAILSIYGVINSFEQNFAINNSLYGDDMFSTATFNTIPNYVSSTLLSDDGAIKSSWINLYSMIYQCNVLLEGIVQNNYLPRSVTNRVNGEAAFLRAYSYFYLVNVWGDVPLLITSNVKINATATRTSVNQVYQQVITDLKTAQQFLKTNYPGEEKVRATSLAATALLARVYLYQKNYINAETEASAIIGSNVINLVPLANVFLKNNQEAILQVWNQSGYTLFGSLIPSSPTSKPTYYLTDSLLNAFEAGDRRRTEWVRRNTVGPDAYYYPYKYKQRATQPGANGEYLTVLRLSEQYLIRAEARAAQNNISGAASDLNTVRSRAGLGDISTALSASEVLLAIHRERRIEFFCECGQRFFDLKRTGKIDAVLGAMKPTWTPNAALYPIPASERNVNPNLSQNPGYY